MAYYTQSQNPNYYANTGHYSPAYGYPSPQTYPQQQQQQQQPRPRPQQPSPYPPSPSPSSSPYPPSPSQYPPSPSQYQTSPSQYPTSPSQYPTSPSQYSTSPSQYPTSPSQYQTSPSKYPQYPQYPPSQPLQPQNNSNYRQNAPGNYPYPPANPSPQNNSFNAPNPTSQANVSKPLFDPSDPKAPKPPSNYGSKYESSVYATDTKFGAGQKKYGGFMGSCCGKRCCCIICCILILIIIAVVVAVVLWAKPPNIQFQGVIPSPDGLPPYEPKGSGFAFNFGLKISVNNPNVVGADFTDIRAIAFYPGHDASIGGGNKTNVHIEKQANTTINFPFSIVYDPTTDPGFTILLDIASKCGLTPGSQKQKITINYLLTLSFKVLAVTLSPSFNRTTEIDCPIPAGTTIPGLNLLGIGSKGS